MRTRHAGRRGLTLIELLVVIAIIVVLLAIVAVVGPHFSERQRSTRGATQLQGWLMIAKQRALRDGVLRGIRLPSLTGSPPYAQYISQVQYIEQPDAYTPATLDGAGNVLTGALSIQADFQHLTLQFSGEANPGSAAAQALAALWPEKANDPSTPIRPDVVLDFYGRYPGQPRRIVDIQPSGVNLVLVLDQQLENPPPPSAPPPTTEYRFYRKAQPIAGEPILQMPKDIAVDISRENTTGTPSWYRLYPPTANSLNPQPLDILFDQTGQVIGSTGRSSNRICLWVRDVSNNTFPNSFNDPNATDPNVLPPGDNTLITIYTRTGLIAVHPIDDSRLTPGPTWNPFSFTQDGRSSGM